MLKNVFIVSILVFFVISCDQDKKDTFKDDQPVPIVENVQPESVEIVEEELAENEVKKEVHKQDWDAYQDSLRTVALAQKPNEELKSGFLQEFYLRGVVRELNDSLEFDIPFDIHGMDCGAPDCYETRLRFVIPYANELVFPKSIHFSEHETGCSENPYYIENKFELVTDTKDHVIYHCAEKKRTLLLYGPHAEHRGALYFLNYEVDDINLSEPFVDEEEGDDKFIYTSWTLTTYEYEFFID